MTAVSQSEDREKTRGDQEQVRELLRKVRRIEIATRRVVNEVMAGQYHSVFKGRGMEFSEVREYQPGDDVRIIDWNVTARTGTPHVKIFSELGHRAPTFLFAKEQPLVDLMAASGADVLSVGRCVDLAEAKRRFGHEVAFQGNVDNRLLVTGTLDEIDDAVRQCVQAGGHQGHILNLNHGLLKDTPFDNACRVIETCKTTVLQSADRPAAGGVQ